jgi:hypothetical protein
MKDWLTLVVGLAMVGVVACSGPAGTLSPTGPTTLSATVDSAGRTSGAIDQDNRSAACDRYARQLREAVQNGRITTERARRLYAARCGETTTTR